MRQRRGYIHTDRGSFKIRKNGRAAIIIFIYSEKYRDVIRVTPPKTLLSTIKKARRS